MRYTGSKLRVAKLIIPIMEAARRPGQVWYEPFVGGGNSIIEASGKRMGSDMSRHAIEGLISIRDHIDELPKCESEFTEENYYRVRKKPESYKHAGFALYSYSFAGLYSGTYAKGIQKNVGWNKRIDFVAQGYRRAKRENPGLQGVELTVASYDNAPIPPQSLIYCDIPYKNTDWRRVYGKGISFCHDEFHAWAQKMANSGHTVFLSEEESLPEYEKVWEKKIAWSSSCKGNRAKAVDKLYRIHPNC